MFIQEAVFILCTGLAIGLSLDNLPHRLNVPSTHRFDSYDRLVNGFDSEFLERATSKRKFDPERNDYGSKSSSYSQDDTDRGALWEMSYPPLHGFREHVKRDTKSHDEIKDKDDQELANILKDDDNDDAGKTKMSRERKIPPGTKRQSAGSKKKRESEIPGPELSKEEVKEKEKEHRKYQDWAEKEYYRNMARTFASMRKKRAMWGPIDSDVKEFEHRRTAPPGRPFSTKSKKDGVSFDDVTDNLKSIEDALLADALKVVKENGAGYENDRSLKRRVTNDMNAAFDIETMRAALFRLRDTLYNMNENTMDIQEFDGFRKYKKRAPQSEDFPLMLGDAGKYFPSSFEQCRPLEVLTSDCAALGDTVPDDSLKDLLSHACNWHEVCYTCGEVFGLNSDDCDMGFIEQSRTICRGDAPCESTSKLLLLPLRQRRVFYKRSNPNVCLVDPCVEDFLTRG